MPPRHPTLTAMAAVFALIVSETGWGAERATNRQTTERRVTDQPFLMSPAPTGKLSILVQYGYAEYERRFTGRTHRSDERRPTNTYQVTGILRIGDRHAAALTIPTPLTACTMNRTSNWDVLSRSSEPSHSVASFSFCESSADPSKRAIEKTMALSAGFVASR